MVGDHHVIGDDDLQGTPWRASSERCPAWGGCPAAASPVLGEGHDSARQVALAEDRDTRTRPTPRVPPLRGRAAWGSVQVALAESAVVSDHNVVTLCAI